MKSDTFHRLVLDKFKIKVKDNHTNTIRREEAHRVMFQNCRIPICLHTDFLKEMEAFKLIKLKDKQNIELLK